MLPQRRAKWAETTVSTQMVAEELASQPTTPSRRPERERYPGPRRCRSLYRVERAFIRDGSISTINRYNIVEHNEQLCNLGSAG
jgi:hypothetical protein